MVLSASPRPLLSPSVPANNPLAPFDIDTSIVRPFALLARGGRRLFSRLLPTQKIRRKRGFCRYDEVVAGLQGAAKVFVDTEV